MDRYKDMGCIMAIGKVEANKIFVGDKVKVMPSGKIADVHRLTVDDEDVKMAGTGENVVVGLKGISDSDIHGGYIICDAENVTPKATSVECQLQLLDLLPHKPLFSVGYSAVFHTHNLAVECEVKEIPHILQKKTGKRSKSLQSFWRGETPESSGLVWTMQVALKAMMNTRSLVALHFAMKARLLLSGRY
eukprot:TRINITY_DN2177_c0_g1_i1.p1 TRINITY_DN2177_c0_g1~~TRINITY_DN2177_c0_g1_i1.p1  ORF type:complete len:190 (-),score=12.49 TRINITY_DN2177_c0_g1_i1:194-763(-)